MRLERSFYATSVRDDAAHLAKTVAHLAKTVARLNNAADMLERAHRRRYVLEDAVRHALENGKMGKQTRRRLKQALKESS